MTQQHEKINTDIKGKLHQYKSFKEFLVEYDSIKQENTTTSTEQDKDSNVKRHK